MRGEAIGVRLVVKEQGKAPSKASNTVEEILEQYGPFLPYTWLFGQPAGTDDFPYWTNLLQKDVYGFEYWAEHVVSALRMAMVGVEALMRTSSPRQVKFLALTPDSHERPAWDPDYWLGIYYDGGHASNKSAWTWSAGWHLVLEEFQRRRREKVQGPEHWVILLIGVNPRLLEKAANGRENLHYTWFDEGPRYAMWPVIVDTYTQWRIWAPYHSSKRFRILGPWSQEHPKVIPDILPFLSHWERLLHLAPDTALLLAGREHMEVVIPQCTWPWREILWSRDPRWFQDMEVEGVSHSLQTNSEPLPAPVSGD